MVPAEPVAVGRSHAQNLPWSGGRRVLEVLTEVPQRVLAAVDRAAARDRRKALAVVALPASAGWELRGGCRARGRQARSGGLARSRLHGASCVPVASSVACVLGVTRNGALAAARACPAAPSACIAAAIAAALTLCVTVCTRPSRVACRCRRGGTEGPATLAAAALVVTPNGVRSAPSAKGRKSSADDPSPSSELLNSSISAIATYLVSVCLAAGQVARQSSRAQLHVPQPVAVSATGGCCDCHSALLAT